MTIEAMLSYGIMFLVVIAIVMFMMFWRLRSNRNYAMGKIKCIFWPETGDKYKLFLPVEENGIEVRAPKGHSLPRYFIHTRI